MYRVEITTCVRRHDGMAYVVRDLELPFPPYNGLVIDDGTTGDDGDLNDDCCEHTLHDVRWVTWRGQFECFGEAYECLDPEVGGIEETVAGLLAFGFRKHPDESINYFCRACGRNFEERHPPSCPGGKE